MIALLQRVTRACVRVDDEVTGAIGAGLVVLLGVERGDDAERARRLAAKTARYRVFASEDGTRPMHRSLHEVGGGALVVSQFTLCADTKKGLRPGFDRAAAPEQAEELYDVYCAELAACGIAPVERGRFRAHMHVELVNDGPVTIWLAS